MSDDELVASLIQRAAEDKKSTIEMLGHLAAMDDRKLCQEMGYHSLYDYCTRKLRFSEEVAYKRIATARYADDHRQILDLLERGDVNLSTLAVIGPHLTKQNSAELLERVKRKSRRDVEMIAASLAPSASRRDAVSKPYAPTATADWPKPAQAAVAGSPPAASNATSAAPSFTFDKIQPVDGEKVRLHFDVGPETAKLLERAREVLRHKFPMASFEDIVKEALKLLLEERDPEIKLKLEKEDAKKVLTAARRVPVWVRRKVWRRDGGQCAFVGPDGTRCGRKGGLEFDHVIPYAKGGRSDDPANIRLLCRTHNQLSGWLEFPPGPTANA